jgi:hypothetical protein
MNIMIKLKEKARKSLKRGAMARYYPVLLVLVVAVTISFSSKAQVGHAAVLEKRNPSRSGARKIYLIGAQHYLRPQLPPEFKAQGYIKRVEETAQAIAQAFLALRKNNNALMVIEGMPTKIDWLLGLEVAVRYCACELLEEGSCGDLDTARKRDWYFNTRTNLLNILADKLAGQAGIVLPDQRETLNILWYILKQIQELPELYEANYKSCLSFDRKKGLTVAQFFDYGEHVIRFYIQEVDEALALLHDPDNRRAAQEFKDFLTDYYLALWLDLKKSFKAFGSSSILDVILTERAKIAEGKESKLEEILQALDFGSINEPSTRQMLPAFDYTLLKYILSLQSPSDIFIAAGYVHTVNLLDILQREGYAPVYDSQLTCTVKGRTEKLEATVSNLLRCRLAKNLHDIGELELDKMLSLGAAPGPEPSHDHRPEL